MGIPSVKREVHSYLTDTLNSLISELTQQEKEDSVIVVLIAEVRQSCLPHFPGPHPIPSHSIPSHTNPFVCQIQCQTGRLLTCRSALLLAGADKPSLRLLPDQHY